MVGRESGGRVGSMWWIIGVILAMGLFLFIMSLCRAAGDADDQLEKMWRLRQAARAAELMRERQGDGD